MHPALIAISLLTTGPIAESIESIPARATVWIRAGDRAVGTGWVVDRERRWIVTARHVLADRESAEVFFQDRREGRAVADRDYYLSERADLANRKRLEVGKLVAKNDNADLAILAVERIPGDVPSLTLATDGAQPGTACFSIGHRHDSELLWCRTTGSVRQVGRLGEGYFSFGKKIGVDVPILFVQSPIEAGESGSALLNQAGRVIGVVSAVANRTPGLAFAIDVSSIRRLLGEARGEAPRATKDAKPEKRADVQAALHATVWVRPQATEGRAAGVLMNREHRLLLTTVSAVGKDDIVDIVAPKWDGERLVAESSEYRDLLGLRLSGHCVQGVVLARDLVRDIAVIELDQVPESLKAIPLAAGLKVGETVLAISHPVGEELLWLHAAGSVRSIGKVTLQRDLGDKAAKVETSLLQLPRQGGSAGGPVVNERGELVGIVATRDGSRQDLAYAACGDEVRVVIKASRSLWKPESSAELQARTDFLNRHGRGSRVRSGHPPESLEELTRAIELAPYDAELRVGRATQHLRAKEYKKAVADFSRLIELEPLNVDWYIALADAQFLAGDRPAAAQSLASVVRIAPKKGCNVLHIIRRMGKSLRDDNAADVERVADWYVAALRQVSARLDREEYGQLAKSLEKAAREPDSKRRMELLALAIDDAAK